MDHQTRLKFEGFLQGLSQAEYASLDTETTGLRVAEGEDYLQGLSIAYKTGGMAFVQYFPFRHGDTENNLDMSWLDKIMDALANVKLVFFNRKFDLHSLDTLNKEFNKRTRPIAYDTLVMAHRINENRPYEKSLDSCCRFYIKKGKVQKDAISKFTSAFGWDAVPSHLMAPYAEGDALITLELFEHLFPMYQRKYGEDSQELWLWDFEMQNSLYRAETIGVEVDIQFCKQYQGIANMEMAIIEAELGFSPSKTTALSKFLFDELKLPVLEYTPGSYIKGSKPPVLKKPEERKPSMAKNVMEEYERMLQATGDHRAQLVLDYRGWQKASSSFYLPFQKLRDSKNKIHCNYKMHGTVTGRLSCSTPNLQQVPRSSDKAWNGKIRTAFKASPGYKLVGFDYSQLELRLAAAYGLETWLIEEFGKDDADPFTVLAEMIGTSRYDAKTFTYAMIYGAGKAKIAKTLKKSEAEIEDSYNAFLASISNIVKVKKMCETKAKSRGYIRYWTGHRRHLAPGESYKAFNALLQGGGAEVVKRVLVNCDKTICDDNCRFLLQVHDELVFEIKEDLVEEYSNRIVAEMESLPTKTFGVRFIVHGKEWG